FNRHEQIDVAIKNTGQKPVSFCVEFGHWSFKDDSAPMEATPTPVYVQAHSERGWHTLLVRIRWFWPLGKFHYPFRLSAAGEMRLILNYWIGENDRTCEHLPHRKTTDSKVFSAR